AVNYLDDPAPVTVTVPFGWWRFYRPLTAPHVVTAAFVAGNEDGVTVGGVDATSTRELEEQLGFALPEAVHSHLTRSDPVADLGPPDLDDTASPPARLPLPVLEPELLPSRRSRLDLDGRRATTWGAVLDEQPPLRTWRHGEFQVDV
nr:hypothetical protein [Micromonospora sp. DSM 115978]